MAIQKPQEEKAASTVALQPKNMERSSVQLIMALDLGGWKGDDIAKELGLSVSRVSIIRNSPLYLEEKKRRFEEIKNNIMSGQSRKAVEGDPVTKVFRENAEEAARKKVSLMQNGKNEFVQNTAATDILAHAGYKPEQKKTTISVMVTDKIASRFERVLAMKTEVTE